MSQRYRVVGKGKRSRLKQFTVMLTAIGAIAGVGQGVGALFGPRFWDAFGRSDPAATAQPVAAVVSPLPTTGDATTPTPTSLAVDDDIPERAPPTDDEFADLIALDADRLARCFSGSNRPGESQIELTVLLAPTGRARVVSFEPSIGTSQADCVHGVFDLRQFMPFDGDAQRYPYVLHIPALGLPSDEPRIGPIPGTAPAARPHAPPARALAEWPPERRMKTSAPSALTPSDVRRIIGQSRYRTCRLGQHDAPPFVEVTLDIDAGGVVDSVDILNETLDRATRNCLIESIEPLRFPRSVSGDPRRIENLSLVF